MTQGTIKIIKDNTWGFISLEDEKDVFFHQSESPDIKVADLEVGQVIEFEDIEKTEKGDRAKNIKVV